MVKVVLQCEPSITGDPCGGQFRVIDSAGTYYEGATGLAEVPNRFELPNIESAYTVTGNVVFLVPISATDLVLDFSWPFNASVLLALE